MGPCGNESPLRPGGQGYPGDSSGPGFTEKGARGLDPLHNPGAEQLALLVSPLHLKGHLSAEWLRRALAQCRTGTEFLECYREDELLELPARCADYLARQGLLIAPERLADRLLALLAVRGRFWERSETLDSLFERCLADAGMQLLQEDQQDETLHLPADPEGWGDYALAGELFGVIAPFQRLVLLRFNRLPHAKRQALFNWVARGQAPVVSAPPTASGSRPAEREAQCSQSGHPARPNSEVRLTLDQDRRMLTKVLALPTGGPP